MDSGPLTLHEELTIRVSTVSTTKCCLVQVKVLGVHKTWVPILILGFGLVAQTFILSSARLVERTIKDCWGSGSWRALLRILCEAGALHGTIATASADTQGSAPGADADPLFCHC